MPLAGAPRWAEWFHPKFWSSVKPILTRGADYAHLHITACPSGMENLNSISVEGKKLLHNFSTKIWSSVKPILTRGADYAHLHINACPSGVENLTASL